MNKQSPDSVPVPNNLPENVAQFVGREEELAELKDYLIEQHSPLVIITGTGGVGKTQLAIQFAATKLAHFKDGAWLVEFSNLDDSNLIAQTLFYTLNLVEQVGKSTLESLLESLRERQLLLILDNCEKLKSGCAQLCELITANCPNIQIIVTSREKLDIANEQLLILTPFNLPPETPGLEEAANLPIVQLFSSRAAELNPRWKLTAQNLPVVLELCRKLDGIPLAITLAAARTRILSVEQILSRIDNMFQLLQTDSAILLPHQQTLKNTLDWSYNLLGKSEQIAWRQLAVLNGNWSLEAAEFLCSSSEAGQTKLEMVDIIESLTNKSLLIAEHFPKTNEIRYRFLETIRQYGLAKLDETGELEILHSKQIEYCLQIVQEAETHLRNAAEQQIWLARLELELPNLRNAFNWTLTRNNHELNAWALQISAKLFGFWYLRGYFTEGFYWIKTILEHAGAGENELPDYQTARAINLRALGLLSDIQGEYKAARIYYTDALTIFKNLGEKHGVASILNNMGLTALQQGWYEEARQQFEEALKYFRELDNQRNIGDALGNLGSIALFSKDYAQAETYYKEALPITQQVQNLQSTLLIYTNLGQSAFAQKHYKQAEEWYELSLALYRETEDKKGIANSLENLGVALLQQGQTHRADQLLQESLEIWRSIGNKTGLVRILEARALLAFHLGQLELSLKLWGAAAYQREVMDVPLEPTYEVDYSRALEITQTVMGAGEFKATLMAGRTLSLEGALELSLKVWSENEDGKVRAWLKPGMVWSEKYLLENQLGRGGMGEVWLVKDIELEEPRAIKFMLAEQNTNSKARLRFVQGEARNALRLEPHPNIVRVYELGFYNELPFIVMEFIKGSPVGADLRAYLKQQGPLTIDQTKILLIQIAAGLEVAHKQGLIHRDIKPANILLGSDTQKGLLCKIGDFGLAKDIESDIELTTHTQIFGTPTYMAPEQARGKATIASDIYALGIMSYEMLAGQPPFKGSAGDLLMQHFSVQPPPLPEDVPAELGKVVFKAIAKNPEDRYASASAFIQEFQAAIVT